MSLRQTTIGSAAAKMRGAVGTEKLVTRRATREQLGLSQTSFIKNILKPGLLKPLVITPGRQHFLQSEIDALIERAKRERAAGNNKVARALTANEARLRVRELGKFIAAPRPNPGSPQERMRLIEEQKAARERQREERKRRRREAKAKAAAP